MKNKQDYADDIHIYLYIWNLEYDGFWHPVDSLFFVLVNLINSSLGLHMVCLGLGSCLSCFQVINKFSLNLRL